MRDTAEQIERPCRSLRTMAQPEDELTETLPANDGTRAPDRGSLVVMRGDGPRRVPLPRAGTLVIGRGEGAQVRIEDASISRRHAMLHLGRTVQIEDLGSANGTRLAGRRLAPGQRAELQPGEAFEVGRTLCMLEGRVAPRPRRLWSHGYFEARLEDECARAERQRTCFAVVRLHLEAPARPEPEAELPTALRPGDIVAAYGPNEYEVLALDVGPTQAAELGAALRAALAGAARGVRIGIACFPSDCRTPESLLSAACARVRPAPAEGEPTQEIVIADPAMERLHQLLGRIASGTINVLLLGETGVGKEIFAEQVHRLSPRAARPFLKLNCASFSEALLESELFGHERGAFTGAVQAKPGLLEAAEGGTVFLDEVGEMPAAIQAKLLRVLEERQVRRVGSLKSHAVNVRFVAATNRDLEGEMAEGRLRSDLYYRLNGISVVIPPLRSRPAEIAPLTRRFAEIAARQMGWSAAPALAPDALAWLIHYSWPGNIRELRNVIERAVLLSEGRTITTEHLPVEKTGTVLRAGPPPETPPPETPPPPPAAATAGPEAEAAPPDERQRLLDALTRCAGNQTYAARLLGISRRTLVTKIEKYNLPRPRKGGPDQA
jgi:DNA-binding NtrC family response regulator